MPRNATHAEVHDGLRRRRVSLSDGGRREGSNDNDSRQAQATASARSAYLAGRAGTPVMEDPTIVDEFEAAREGHPPDWAGIQPQSAIRSGIAEPRRYENEYGERGGG